MSVIFHIMEEEYKRLLEAEKVYRKSVKNAVQGAPRVKRIHKRDYLYLERREGNKVIDEYIGPAQSEKALRVLNTVNKRRKDLESLRKVRHDLKDVKKVLHGKI